MWRNKIQVCSDNISMRVALKAILVGSGIISAKPSFVLEETCVTQSQRFWSEKSQALSSLILKYLKPAIDISFILPTMSSE